jgi:hypothetical protein
METMAFLILYLKFQDILFTQIPRKIAAMQNL